MKTILRLTCLLAMVSLARAQQTVGYLDAVQMAAPAAPGSGFTRGYSLTGNGVPFWVTSSGATFAPFLSRQVAESSSFTVNASDVGTQFEVTTGSSAVTVTLAAGTLYSGFSVRIRKVDSGTGLITTSPAISPSATSLGIQGHVLEITSDGTNYYARLYYGGNDSSGNLSETAYANFNLNAASGSTLNLNTTSNAAITTGTGLFTIAQDLRVSRSLGIGTAASGTAGQIVAQQNSLGTTSTDGLVLQNTTAATSGQQQYSPRIRFRSYGWTTATGGSSQSQDWIIENRPTSDTPNSDTNLFIGYSIAGGTYQQIAQFGSAGSLEARLVLGSGATNTSGIYFGGGTPAGPTNPSIIFNSTAFTIQPSGVSVMKYGGAGVSGNVYVGFDNGTTNAFQPFSDNVIGLGLAAKRYLNLNLGPSGITIANGTSGGATITTTGASGSENLVLTPPGGLVTTGTAGQTFAVKSGTNAASGTVTLSSGSATITSTAIDANTVIILSTKTASGTQGLSMPRSDVASGSATITGAATDNSTYNWVALKVN